MSKRPGGPLPGYTIPKQAKGPSPRMIQVSQHAAMFLGRHDRYCCWCGWIIKNQNIEKTAKCTNSNCAKPVPIRYGVSNDGWTRCVQCDAYKHEDHLYCSMCVKRSDTTYDRINAQKDFKIKELEAKLAAKEKELRDTRKSAKVFEMPDADDEILSQVGDGNKTPVPEDNNSQ